MDVEAAAGVISKPATPLSARSIAWGVLGASATYGLANFGIRALNFLLLPVYTRYLTPADYGIVTLAETVAAFLVSVIGLGFNASMQRLYFHHVDRAADLQSYIGSVLKAALFVEFAFLALSLTFGSSIQRVLAPHYAVPFRYIGLAITTAIATQLFNYRLVLYQAERKPKVFVLLSFLAFGLTASLCVFFVVVARRGAIGMLTGKLGAALIVAAVAMILVRHALASSFHWSFVRETAAMGLPLVPHLLMALGLVSADRFILEHYRDLHAVGLYSVAYTFGMIMSLVTMSLNQAWAPIYYDLARQSEDGRRVLSQMCSGLIIALAAIACFGSSIARDFIAHFLDRRYAAAGRVVPWIIGAYFAHSLFSMFCLAAMQARRTKVLVWASFLALVLNTLLNFALIPGFGMYGAAYATFGAYVVEAVVMYFLAQRMFRLEL